MIGMRSNKVLSLCCVLALVAGTWADDVEYTRERYDVIVDRSPFGEDPLTPSQEARANMAHQDAATASAAAQALAKELRLCFLLESENGQVRAGFQNLKARSGDPLSIMLLVGESFRGMKLTQIDLPNSSATLLHMGKPVTFELSKAPASAVTPPPKNTKKKPTRRFGGGFRKKKVPEPVKPAKPALSPAEESLRREEMRENLRQYQMKVIREGMPPLPLPLTQEMDDQLVLEGVLPPME